ncbi:synaptogenesis protein syg-2 [Ochlerotatus camptorhynchus]|uniref:synaptogenesis protein syg-2 n=1 Tax=Ochlerotatus camptorhynchus TaxID=644619 RepID=UPI0031DE51B9
MVPVTRSSRMEIRKNVPAPVLLLLVMTAVLLGGTGRIHVRGEAFKSDVPVHVESVLVNDTAQIKCDVSSNLPNDRILLVVWYKDNVPIYSYDTRVKSNEAPSHWRDGTILENRANFKPQRDKSRAELVISPVLKKDAGVFRCRVDFLLSPTKNSNVNLEIVVPPEVPKIQDSSGFELPVRAGPYEEGGILELTCVVRGGIPTPKIIWSSNGKVLPSTMMEYSHESTLSSKLVVRNLSRDHQHTVYTCQASNFFKRNVTANVTIELRLRPLVVEIVNGSTPLSSDRHYVVQCQSSGSRPPAKISWWLDEKQLMATNQTTSENGNCTTSLLSFTPTRDDHGRTLTCRAINELVKRGTKETSIKLNIFYLPTLKLELGTNMNPEDIEEGDDVYFECKVNANPSAYKVVWKHNDQVVQHNSKTGVIMSSTALALQAVTRHQAGNYTCIASNVEGDGESNTVDLKVMYKPICRPDQKKIYGVARNEPAEILCQVDAYPPPESFKWSFNNTAETIDMPQSGYRVHSDQASSLTYTPVKELDYGTIMCWADNAVGQQREPCVFHLIAAGKPEMPYNCSLVNQTSESLEVNCGEGFDGGQRQVFVMEIYDQQTHMLLANVSSGQPMFTVRGLESGRLLKIVIYATNMRGRSEAIYMLSYTLKPAEKQTGPHAEFELSPILSIGIFIGILTVIICIIIAVAAALKLRTSQPGKGHHAASGNGKAGGVLGKRPSNLPIKEKISVPLSQSEDMYDEKNPDVVPTNEDPDYKLISANQTPTALHNSLCNSKHDIIGRTILDDSRKTYLTGSSNEVHYAELALAIPHDDSSNKNHLNHLKKLPPPPAYNYFDEPTIYAQIDHGGSNYKTSTSPFPLISPVSQQQGPTQQQQQQQSLNQSQLTLQLQQQLPTDHHSHSQQHTPTSLQNHHQQHTPTSLQQPPPQLQLHQQQQQQQQQLPNNNKQYLREIVTVRTPLAFSQQESCV